VTPPGGAPRTPVVTFLSDYGPFDEFVGVCHGVVARIAPDARVLDVAHGVRGVRAGAAMLAQAVPYLPDAVHLAVVDPGVGTTRLGVVVVSMSGSALVGPDNGLLVPAAEALGGVAAAYEIAEPRFMLPNVSATFHGRDVFAPAAAHLANGVRPNELGPRVAQPVRLSPLHVDVRPGRIRSDVLRADHFGNVQLAATADDLSRSGLTGRVRVNGVHSDVGRTFADVQPGCVLVHVDAGGHVSVAVNLGRADDLFAHPMELTISSD
jgi:S-adenosylmethionine hydrolase